MPCKTGIPVPGNPDVPFPETVARRAFKKIVRTIDIKNRIYFIVAEETSIIWHLSLSILQQF